MAPVPTAETPPAGLDAYWLGVWRHALRTLKAQGTWAWELRPLLDEYVFALASAAVCRAEGADSQWDRHAKRASALADQLVLTPRGRRAVAVGEPRGDERPAGPLSPVERITERRGLKAV